MRLGKILLLLLGFSLFFGCSDSDVQTSTKQSGSKSGPQPTPQSVNRWTTIPPSKICGPSGYNFLISQYIGPNCASCHSPGSFTNMPFVDTNLASAISSALSLGEARFLAKCVSNNFCGPYCNLDPKGEVYSGIVEWFNSPNTCP